MANPRNRSNVVNRLDLDDGAADFFIDRLGGLAFDFDRNRYQDQEGSRYGYQIAVAGSGANNDVLRGTDQRAPGRGGGARVLGHRSGAHGVRPAGSGSRVRRLISCVAPTPTTATSQPASFVREAGVSTSPSTNRR